jgi:peptidyl-prolyl cis-trans isomerase C
MPKTLIKVALTAAALTVALPVYAKDNNLDTVVATVNGKDITLGHMLMVRAGLPPEYAQLPTDALWDGIMEQIVQQEALAQSKDATETKRVKLALDNERRSLLAAEAIGVIAEAATTDEALQVAYEAKYETADQSWEYNASHILLENEADAMEVLKMVKGGSDFAETAKSKSTGPTGANGGELGWFGAGTMVEAFQTAVEALEPGDITGPVKTQFGWHVIKLNDSRVKEAPKLEDVRDALAAEVQQKAVQDHIDRLMSETNVTRTSGLQIDTSILSDLSLLEKAK